MKKNAQDRKEETYNWLPRAEDIAPDKVFGVGEATVQKLNKMLGMSLKAGMYNLFRLKEEGRAHIHTWTRTSHPSPVWVKGPGEDAPKPPPATPLETTRRYNERRREKDKAARAQSVHVTSIEVTARTIEQAKAKPMQWWSGLGDMPGEERA